MSVTGDEVSGRAPGRELPKRPAVLLAGFEALFARVLYGVLRESSLVDVLHTNLRGADAARAFDAHRPGAALLCWEQIDALDLKQIARAYPETGVVVIAHRLTGEQARALARCGAVAALERGVSRQLLIAATVVAAHGMRVEPRSHGFAMPAVASLSTREAEVLGLLECGESAAAIARVLGVSAETVKSQTRAIYRKLGVHSRDELRERLRQWPRSRPEAAAPADGGGSVVRLDAVRRVCTRVPRPWWRAPLGSRPR